MKPKLVRDLIPSIIKHTGRIPEYESVTDVTTFRRYLREKLLEEAQELYDALESRSIEDISGEIADVAEVLMTISREYNTPSMIDLARDKAFERGGFLSKTILKGVSK